jgi:hypothetical protein
MSDAVIFAAFPLLSPGWVRAIRAVESGGNPSAVRFEPQVFDRLVGPSRSVVVKLDPTTASEAQRAALRAQRRIPFTPDPQRHISLVSSETSREAMEFARKINDVCAVRASSFGLFQDLGRWLVEADKNTTGHHLLAISDADVDKAVADFDADPSGMSDRMLVAWLQDSPETIAAMMRGDVDAVVTHYNGSKPGTPQHDHYAARMRAALGT